MNREDKIYYLEKYKRAKERYQELSDNLYSLHGIKYGIIKTAVHKTLAEKIGEVDKAFYDKLDAFDVVKAIIDESPYKNIFGYDSILYAKFISLENDKDIANDHDLSLNELKKEINKRIDSLDI